MSALHLYDDAKARTFEPFALTRPVGELRTGALLGRERWASVIGGDVVGSVSASHLASFDEPGAAPVVDGDVPAGAWIVNSRAIPSLARRGVDSASRIEVAGRLAAVRVRRAVRAEELGAGDVTLEAFASSDQPVLALEGAWLDDVWDLIGRLVPVLQDDIARIAEQRGVRATAAPADCRVIGEKVGHALHVEEGAHVEPFVTFDLSGGSIYLERGSTVQSFTRITGPTWIGSESVVGSDKIAACSIGAVCKVHGEVANTVFLGHCNKAHDGFVGHSYLGRWVNLGANTVTSNLKNTYGPVELWTPGGIQETKEQFIGTLFGDHAKTGIGLKLTTGTVLGAGAQVYGLQMPPKVVPPFAWGDRPPYQVYRLDKFLEVAARMMSRRHVELTSRARAQLEAAHVRSQRAEIAGLWKAGK